MQKLQHLELDTLKGMLDRHRGYYTRMMKGKATKRQLSAAQKLISIIQEEINSRLHSAISEPSMDEQSASMETTGPAVENDKTSIEEQTDSRKSDAIGDPDSNGSSSLSS